MTRNNPYNALLDVVELATKAKDLEIAAWQLVAWWHVGNVAISTDAPAQALIRALLAIEDYPRHRAILQDLDSET